MLRRLLPCSSASPWLAGKRNRHAYIVAMACYDIVILFIIRSARVRHAHAWHVRRAAGVERVFSAAGKMHDNLRKSMQDSTLEHSLFAAFNIERAIINPPSSIKTSHQHRKDISAVLSVWLLRTSQIVDSQLSNC